MSPYITDTKYGSITINGRVYHQDIMIFPDKEVQCCNGQLKKLIFGCSHELTRESAEKLWQEGLKWLIIGTGKFCRCCPTQEALQFLCEKGCQVCLMPTPKAVQVWNNSKGDAIGIFHIS